MCLPWCSCLGAGRDHEDDYYGSTAKGGGAGAPLNHHTGKTTPATTTSYPYPPAHQHNGHHGVAAHHANGHHHRQQPLPGADEEGHKASNDYLRRGGHAPAAGAEGKAYVYPGADGTLRHPTVNA